MRLIVGLGNPGKEYANTRHNVGFMFIDEVASKNNITLSLDKSKRCEIGQFTIRGEKILLVKPITYMNLSGEAVRLVVDYYKIDINDILIIHDDLDLPTGKIRLRQTGSSGGHNGIKSIIANLKTQDFKRVKIGIDKSDNVIDYVLGDFSKREKDILLESLNKANDIVNDFTILSFNDLMSKYN